MKMEIHLTKQHSVQIIDKHRERFYKRSRVIERNQVRQHEDTGRFI